MIRINPDFYHSLNQDTLDEPRTHILLVWSGTVPTDEEINALKDVTPRLGYNFTTLISDFASAGRVCQGELIYATDFRSKRNQDSLIQEFASRPEELKVKGEELLTFFTMVVADGSGINLSNSSGTANMIILGSIGDIGSGADLELPTGALDQDTTYKADDFTFNFV